MFKWELEIVELEIKFLEIWDFLFFGILNLLNRQLKSGAFKPIIGNVVSLLFLVWQHDAF